jgi:hypothetical protein
LPLTTTEVGRTLDEQGDEKKMKTAVVGVMLVGRATVFAVGLAVKLALMLGAATAALAAVPGDPFKLGRLNTVNRISQLAGATTDAMLRIDNNGAGSALQLLVESGKAPVTVNAEAGIATNLSADELDGQDSAAFFSGKTYGIFRVEPDSGGGGASALIEASCDPGDRVLGGGGGSLGGGDTLSKSIPIGGGTGWRVVVRDNGSADTPSSAHSAPTSRP